MNKTKGLKKAYERHGMNGLLYPLAPGYYGEKIKNSLRVKAVLQDSPEVAEDMMSDIEHLLTLVENSTSIKSAPIHRLRSQFQKFVEKDKGGVAVKELKKSIISLADLHIRTGNYAKVLNIFYVASALRGIDGGITFKSPCDFVSREFVAEHEKAAKSFLLFYLENLAKEPTHFFLDAFNTRKEEVLATGLLNVNDIKNDQILKQKAMEIMEEVPRLATSFSFCKDFNERINQVLPTGLLDRGDISRNPKLRMAAAEYLAFVVSTTNIYNFAQDFCARKEEVLGTELTDPTRVMRDQRLIDKSKAVVRQYAEQRGKRGCRDYPLERFQDDMVNYTGLMDEETFLKEYGAGLKRKDMGV